MGPLFILGALSALPLAVAHMQMSSPSPLRDPHATDRPDEPKDYNILSPLNADGSNFACKGYHLNTPLTTVATYEAGSKQTLRLKGSATHGGGSCQISMSCNKGADFHVLKSIIGGCPLKNSYDFRVPSDLPPAKKCLLAWTWFNRIGNREMYMNCAVVDITNKRQSKRDTQISPAKALSRYPELFVANLANINSCKIQETTDVIFDNPGKYVSYGNGDNASMKPSFRKGQCTGKPSKNAGSQDSSPSNYGGGGQSQWSSPAQSPSESGDCATKIRDGFYHPECSGGSPRTSQQEQQPGQQQPQRPQPPSQGAPKTPNRKRPNTKVQQDLDAYLATLYGRGYVRRDTVPVSDYFEAYSQKKDYSAEPHAHIHGKDCKHKTSAYSPDPHYYNNEDVDLYSEDNAGYHNKDVYSDQDSQYHGDADYAYKRVTRERRWTSYNKRADGPRKPIKYYRGDESAYYVQQAPNQASTEAPAIQVLTDASKPVTEPSSQVFKGASDQVSTEVSKQASTEASAQGSTQAETQTSSEAAAYKAWNEMTEAEKFDAFLRRMVELSNNMASLVKYAAASTVNLPWYPPASTYDRAPESTNESSQRDSPVRRLARRGLLASARSPAQVYPGPSVGSISAPGDATDADDGFKVWFPHLVQGLVTKRQLVDPVTSQASAEAGDSVNVFDALAASFWKLFGDPFNYYGDDSGSDTDSPSVPETESAPDAEDIPLVLGEPDFYNAEPDFPDFDIPDLDGHYTFPPQIFAPEPPVPELLPGYKEGPDGPVWVGEGPDPLGDESSSAGPFIIISVEPIDSVDDSEPTLYPGQDFPTLSCTQPIQQIGFNSCLGGCSHTAEEIAAHEVYLQNFAKEQAEFEECLKKQALDTISPTHSWGIWRNHDDANDAPSEAEDASGRHPRPGSSHPLIPYPPPDNFTGPYPSNATEDVAAPSVDSAAPVDDPRPELLPYQNKTLGELVSEILENPAVLPSSSDDDDEDDAPGNDAEATNPLQEAADQAEEGITVPQQPVEIDPNTLDSIADALPWFLAPGPVITNDVPADAPGSQV